MIKEIINKFFNKKPSKLKINEQTEIELKPDDVFLVSFPKSGNTWVRHLIGNYISDGEMNFSNGPEFMPDIHFNPEQINKIKFRPRFIKSHFPFPQNYPKVIYLVRDGRSVAVSLYYFLKKMNAIDRGLTFKEFLNAVFFSDKYQFGLWGKHVDDWTSLRKKDILVIRYEDLLLNPEKKLTEILEFSGIKADQNRVKMACEKSSFSEMQKDEELQNEKLKLMGHDFNQSGIKIVREGKTNSWMDYFDRDDLKKFDDYYSETMKRMSYYSR